MPDPARTCKGCLFWRPLTGSDAGECRRHAPPPWTKSSESIDTTRTAWWPNTADDDWCGDWHPKAQEQQGSSS